MALLAMKAYSSPFVFQNDLHKKKKKKQRTKKIPIYFLDLDIIKKCTDLYKAKKQMTFNSVTVSNVRKPECFQRDFICKHTSTVKICSV